MTDFARMFASRAIDVESAPYRLMEWSAPSSWSTRLGRSSAIEALQKAYFKASGSAADRRIVGDERAWKEVSKKIYACISESNLTDEAKKILINKAQNLNVAPPKRDHGTILQCTRLGNGRSRK
jgi:hypothetical protein